MEEHILEVLNDIFVTYNYSLINDKLTLGEIEYLFDDLSLFEKCSYFNNITCNDFFKEMLIDALDLSDKEKEDELRIKGLMQLTDDFVKSIIINKLNNVEKKVELLNILSDDSEKWYILNSLKYDDKEKEDELKLDGIKQFKGNLWKRNVISSLNNQEKKLEMLTDFDDEFSRVILINSISLADKEKEDELKIKGLMQLTDEHYKIDVIMELNNDRIKLDYINSLENMVYKLRLVTSLNDDDIKISCLSMFDDGKKVEIIKSLNSVSKFMECLNFIDDDVLKNKMYIERIISENDNIENKLLLLDKLKWFEDNSREECREKKDIIISQYNNISSDKTRDFFVKYINENNSSITKDELEKFSYILEMFDNSNSLEFCSLKNELLPLILSSKNQEETFYKIEKIFLKNNLPMFGKAFLCFKTLYPNFERDGVFDFGDDSRISPELLNPIQTKEMKVVNRRADVNDIRFQIVFNDLLRIASKSNNRSLKEYLKNIEQGNSLFLGIQNGIIKFDDLDIDSKKVLQVFSEHLIALYEQTKMGSEEVLNDYSVEDKIKYFSLKFKPTSRYDLPDRIVRSFAYSSGYKSFNELKDVVYNSYKDKEKVSRKRSDELKNGKKLVLEKGDFIRCIGGVEAVESSLDNGNVSKEFLGTFVGTSNSDTTPLDIDWTLITKDNESIYSNVLGSPTGFGFGNIYVVIKKDNPRLNITRDKDGNLCGNSYNPDKVEVFGTHTSKGGYESHWGMRTGIASSDIDYFVFKEKGAINANNPYKDDGSINYVENNSSNELAILKNEIVKGGFYIPIVDFSGKLIFSREEYDMSKEKIEGLSYYENNSYDFKECQKNVYVDKIKGFLDENRRITNYQSSKIYDVLSSAINKVTLDNENGKKIMAVDEIGIDITPGTVEVLETGSSKRGTNIPYNYDFDYIFRMDAKYLNNPEIYQKIVKQLCSELGIENVPTGDFRDIEVDIPGLGKINIDISFIKKNDKVEYSTEMALKDRLDTIERISSKMRDEVTANIILAKMLFKSTNCYKPARKDINQGGLGGVGIENWIGQNGGSLESAAKSFMEVANNCSTFEEFRKIYHVHDYGKNHLYQKRLQYPYDDFVYDNMNSNGYLKMKDVLGRYLRYVNGEKDVLPELDEYLSNLEKLIVLENDDKLKEVCEINNSRSKGNITVLMIVLLSIISSIITVIISLG